jgi:hypothetical protein
MFRPSVVDNCLDGAAPFPVSRCVSVSHTKEYRVNEKPSKIRPAARQLSRINADLPHAYRYGIKQSLYELHDFTPYPQAALASLVLEMQYSYLVSSIWD